MSEVNISNLLGAAYDKCRGDRRGAGYSASLESMLDTSKPYDERIGMIQSAAELHGDGNLNHAQKLAFSIIAAASGNPNKYASVATESFVPRAGEYSCDYTAPGIGGAYGVFNTPIASLEAFDNRTMDKFVAASAVMNCLAARSTPFAEAFFPTITMAPDQGGGSIELRTLGVMNHFTHASNTSGDVRTFGRKRLVDAYIDQTILADNTSELFPEYDASNPDNVAKFVSDAVAAPHDWTAGVHKGVTKPLKTGVSANLINLTSVARAAINGTANYTDNFDPVAGVKSVTMVMDGGDAFEINVEHLSSSKFYVGPNSQSSTKVLSMDNDNMRFSAKIKCSNGANGVFSNAVLKNIVDNKYSVYWRMAASGSIDLEIGNTIVSHSLVSVRKIVNDDTGLAIDITTGVGKQIADAFANGLRIDGWTPLLRFSNLNRREIGFTVNRRSFRERFEIPLKHPVTVWNPIDTNGDGSDEDAIRDMKAILDIRETGDSITKLLNHYEELQNWNDVIPSAEYDDVLPIEGIMRYVLRKPWTTPVDTVIDLEALVKSTSSNTVTQDLRAVVCNTLTRLIAECLQQTNLRAGYRTITGEEEPNFMVQIGTTEEMAPYIMIEGDTRTLGPGLSMAPIVTTVDQRLRGVDENKVDYHDVYFTFTRPQSGDGAIDYTNYGNRFMIPEMCYVTNPVNRSGAMVREVTLQPRSICRVHLPILGRVRIKNLNAAMKHLLPYQVQVIGEVTTV